MESVYDGAQSAPTYADLSGYDSEEEYQPKPRFEDEGICSHHMEWGWGCNCAYSHPKITLVGREDAGVEVRFEGVAPRLWKDALRELGFTEANRNTMTNATITRSETRFGLMACRIHEKQLRYVTPPPPAPPPQPPTAASEERAGGATSDAVVDDDVVCSGSRTLDERNAEGFANAIVVED
jgi:hypothetical protein